MLFTIALFALPLALAAPAADPSVEVPAALLYPRQAAVLCSGTTGNPQCCATDVLGLADLNCANPPTTPMNTTNFVNICSAIGQQAECCAIPILGQALICQKPI
ncbi:hypothetical protein EJ06DRAFT_20090 [Trichodelitschia bisporula]|uniref:Hydrophobin n=1 Tax=Trichodelitschia bisporula TaxID=703511 RepID=A0A6G1IB06_9PEZI|nr:hypothetical protein EJ06DRAFT_20090 [Trichodelitschia bisporula]